MSDESIRCPHCGEKVSTGDDARELVEWVVDKMDHPASRNCLWEWFGVGREMYVYIPPDNMYTRSVSHAELPDPWEISTTFMKPDEMVVSIKKKGREDG